MKEVIRKDILRIIKETIEVLKKENFRELKRISNLTIHTASLSQDQDSISIAVNIYTLYKILEIFEPGEEVVVENAIKILTNAQTELKNNDIANYRRLIKNLFKVTSKADKEFGTYIEKVLERSQIKKGLGLYKHGLTIGQVAFVLGVTKWELMEYLGKTRVIDEENIPFDIIKRMETTRGIFNL